MSTLLMTLLMRVAWIAGVVALVIGVFAIARRLAVRFTGWRPAELSLPMGGSVPSVLARRVESVTVWLIGLALVGAGLLNVWRYGVDLDVVPVAQQRHEFAVLGLLATLITGLAVIGVVWRMGFSIVAIGVLLSAYFSLLDQGTISRRAADEADLAACPIEIRMEDGTVGADVWANGVLLGQTPIKMTLADWRKLPKWLDAPTTGPEGREVDATRASRRTRWINCVVRPDRRWVTSAIPEGVYFLWVEIGGEPLVAAHASQANVSFDGVQWMSSPIMILGQSPRWLTALDRLLDQVRARDYRIDSPDEWLAALHSFGEGGWRAALRTAESEPLLSEMLDELLRYEMCRMQSVVDVSRGIGEPAGVSPRTTGTVENVRGLTHPGSPDRATRDAAWAIFERLERQVTEARDYQSESRIGRSLELLLPQLDPNRLARYAAGVVDEMRWVPSLSSWDHGRRGDQGEDWRGERRSLTLSPSSKDVTHFRRREQLARLSILTHAVWKMDEWLDQQETDEAGDNVIERLVVPALLRRKVDSAEVWSLGMRLGGSFEDRQFQVWFRDWRRRRPGHEFQFAPNFWNMTQGDQSEAARRWRRQHPDEVLAFAESIGFEENHIFEFGSSESDVSAESLAERFWPKYRDRVMRLRKWTPVKKLGLMWQYLIRMEPHSTPEMYVSAWRTNGIDLFLAGELQLGNAEIATRLSYEKRKAIIAALTAEAQARLKFALSDEARQKVAEREGELQKIIDDKAKRDATASNDEKEFSAVLIAEAQARLNSAKAEVSPRRVEELNEVLRQITKLERSVFASAAQIALQQFAYLEDKESAFESLAEVMTRESPARPELLELLDSPDSKNRLLAARVIRTHPAPQIRPLLDMLLSDGDADVKRLANETQTEWQQLATESPRTWEPK